MSDILKTTDFPMVRYMLGVGDDSLPDVVIDAEVNLNFVEAIVKGLADAWSTGTGFDEIKEEAADDWTFLRTGTVALLAARLVGYVRMKEADSVRIGDYGESGRGMDWRARVSELLADAWNAFSLISTRTFSRPDILIAAGPTSSKAAVPEYFEEWEEKILPRILDWAEEGGENDTYYSA